MKKLSGLREGY